MKIYKYGIILERLKEDDIELVRQWRNSDQVRLKMEYREIITPDQQLKWYRSINNYNNNYMMIHYQGEKIGIVNDKNINWEERTSESGVFIGRTEYLCTNVPFFISIAGIELNFYMLNWKKQFAHILQSNTNAIKYNLQLGYKLIPGQEGVENQLYELTLDNFETSAKKVRKAVRALAIEDLTAKLLIEPADHESEIGKHFNEMLRLRPDIMVTENEEGTWYHEVPTNHL